MKKLNNFLLSALFVSMFTVFSIGTVQAGPCELPDFDSNNFGAPADNFYLSTENKLNPTGYTYVYEAETEDGLIRDYQWFYTPSPPLYIYGVAVTVVYDVEYLLVEELGAWVIHEETWDWHAWDNDGNFWYFGEDTLAHEWNDDWSDCTTSTAGAWEAGEDVAGVGSTAEPGIILLADPKPGDCVLQEFYEGEAEDRGKVLRRDGNASDWCDKDCLATKEWTKLDPGNVEHKYYAPDLGLVYIEELKEKTVIFELVESYSGSPVLSTPIYPCPCCSP